jgi:hypothetical protein
MKTQNKTIKAFLGAGLLSMMAAGCSASVQAEAQAPQAGTGAEAQASGAEPGTAGGAQSPSAAKPKDTTPELPKSAAECVARASKPAASPAFGAPSEPHKQLDDLFQAQHESFRCCYDALYAPKAPRASGQVALLVKVDKAGKLISSEVLASESSVQAPDVHACVVDVSKALVYPKATNDMAVGYKRTFDFKARR